MESGSRLRDYTNYSPRADYIDRNGRPHPMALIEVIERAGAVRHGTKESPWISPTAKFHSSNYLFDGCQISNICTDYGEYKKAAKQLNTFRYQQLENGMVRGVKHPPKKLKNTNINFSINPEIWLSTEPFEGYDYSQTPDWANSVLRLYRAANDKPATSPQQEINPDVFLSDIYPDLHRYYQYFINTREIASDDPRVFNIHAHEDNRDSAPEHDPWKQTEIERQLGKLAIYLERKPRQSEHMPFLFNQKNRLKDYIGATALNIAGYKANWDPARIREKNEYIDVWYNCFLQRNYLAMSELSELVGEYENAANYNSKALLLEQKILEKHYFKDARGGDGAFYSIYGNNPVAKDTAGNLMPYLLENILPKQLNSLNVLVSKGFNTPFMVPSVATDNTTDYDPHHEEEDRPWRGPVWGPINIALMEGLDKQLMRGLDDVPESIHSRCRDIFFAIHESNLDMVDITGDYAEYNNPITGQGQRMHRTKGHLFGALMHKPTEVYENQYCRA